MKLILLIFIYITFSVHPVFAQMQSFRISTFLAYHSKHILDLENSLGSSGKGISKFNIKYDTVNSASQLALNYDRYNSFTLDGSYLQYTKGIATFGVGKVDRHWSFSDNTSLILSNNARPSESFYLKLKNRFGYDWLPTKANWSLEVFNGLTNGSELVGNLKSQFSGGCQYKCVYAIGIVTETVQDGQSKGHGFSGTCFGTSNAVLPIEDCRDAIGLNRSWLFQSNGIQLLMQPFFL